MKNKYLLIIAFSILIVSCKPNSNSNYSGHDANTHMHKSSFNELVKRFEDPKRNVWQQPSKIVGKIGSLENKKVVDIGAGTGYLSFKIAQSGAEVIAKDVDKRFIRYMDSIISITPDSINIKTELIPYDNPKIEEMSVDIVTILNAYHHINDRSNYFFKVWKGLKDGGELYVIDFKKKKTAHGPPEKMRIDEMQVSKELKKAGFAKVIIDMNTLEEQYIITAKKVLKKEDLMDKSKKYDN